MVVKQGRHLADSQDHSLPLSKTASSAFSALIPYTVYISSQNILSHKENPIQIRNMQYIRFSECVSQYRFTWKIR